MISSDYHTHSYFSSDSEAQLTDMINSAVEKGLTALCLTDHMDIDFPADIPYGPFVFDPDEYDQVIAKLQSENEDRICLVKGIELGLSDNPSTIQKMKELLSHHEYEFVIGSNHIVENMDPYLDNYWAKYPDMKGMIKYFEKTLDYVKAFDDFDVLGHIDYCARVCPIVDADGYQYMDYKNLLEEIVRTLISKGKGLEVNTAPMRKGKNFFHPSKDILSFYQSLGGELITVGSDAHFSEDIAANFDEACKYLRSIGYKYYTEFYNRIPVMRILF